MANKGADDPERFPEAAKIVGNFTFFPNPAIALRLFRGDALAVEEPDPNRPARAPARRGRGTEWNPKNRFEKLEYTPDPPGEYDEPMPAPRTEFFRDDTQSILSRNESPDVGFEVSVNPYRGCEHGCSYCYARPTHEYLGWSAGLDFESRILVKQNAPELLRKALDSPRWEPQRLVMSGVTDCYQPVERRLEITRRCLGVLVEFRNPVEIITKNHLVTRDIDLLSALASHRAAAVNLSVTTLDPALARVLEPRVSPPSRRLAAIRELSAAGVPVRAMVAPVIPGLNDHEIPAILEAVAEAGASGAGYVVIRLPLGVGPIFERWLEEHFPGSKTKILERIRDMRGGKLNDSRFGSRMRGEGIHAEMIRKMFSTAARKAGLDHPRPSLSTAAFRRPGEQLTLF